MTINNGDDKKDVILLTDIREALVQDKQWVIQYMYIIYKAIKQQYNIYMYK